MKLYVALASLTIIAAAAQPPMGGQNRTPLQCQCCPLDRRIMQAASEATTARPGGPLRGQRGGGPPRGGKGPPGAQGDGEGLTDAQKDELRLEMCADVSCGDFNGEDCEEGGQPMGGQDTHRKPPQCHCCPLDRRILQADAGEVTTARPLGRPLRGKRGGGPGGPPRGEQGDGEGLTEAERDAEREAHRREMCDNAMEMESVTCEEFDFEVCEEDEP